MHCYYRNCHLKSLWQFRECQQLQIIKGISRAFKLGEIIPFKTALQCTKNYQSSHQSLWQYFVHWKMREVYSLLPPIIAIFRCTYCANCQFPLRGQENSHHFLFNQLTASRKCGISFPNMDVLYKKCSQVECLFCHGKEKQALFRK